MSTSNLKPIGAKKPLLRRAASFIPTFGADRSIAMAKPMTGLLSDTLSSAKKLLALHKVPQTHLTFAEVARASGANEVSIAQSLRYQNCRAFLFMLLAGIFVCTTSYIAVAGDIISAIVHIAFCGSCLVYASIGLFRSAQISARSFEFGYVAWFKSGQWFEGFNIRRVFNRGL